MNHLPKKSIEDIVFDILLKSKSLDVFPTPINKIVEYCELRLDGKNDFHNIPHNYLAKNVDAFQRMMKKVLGALDREQKTIYVDPTLPNVKQNFIKLHEVGHDALTWQKEVKYIDDEHTLNPDIKEQFEAEANYFASASLFQLSRFKDEMNKLPLELGSPMALAKKFGGSNHASIRRYAEISKKRCALIVLEDKEKKGSRFSLNLRNSFQSKSFTKEFGEITWPEKLDTNFPFIQDYSRNRKFHKDGTIHLQTLSGFVEFTYHYFNNRYNVFVFIIPTGEKIKSKTTIYVTSEMPK
jgi:Zn-dependent peptidase ImmA (M78 family)